ncbi:MAG: thioredoxin [Haloplanus sp.]
MAEPDELDDIRARKRERLERDLNADEGGDAPDEPVHVDGAAHLADLTDEYDVVLVDFYADWCGPCKMLEPTVEAVAAETRAAVAKVDVDANPRLADQYGVRGVPMLLLFADGDPVERMVGVQEKARLADLVSAHA